MADGIGELLARHLDRNGPGTGAELQAALGVEAFPLWRAARTTPGLLTIRVGRRYVRLDRKVDGYARLSPSIQREFLTYTVVGTESEEEQVRARVAELGRHFAAVSDRKLALAREVMTDVGAEIGVDLVTDPRTCVLVAGDIVYRMAHEVDRPERSTGTMVNGSDLDIVVIVADDAGPGLPAALDATIHRKKHRYLSSPAFREEIDYVVKPLTAVADQARFDTFRRMVACKIIDEAELLLGSAALFQQARDLLDRSGVIDRLRGMERDAIAQRAEREDELLRTPNERLSGEDLVLFLTDEESEEFE